ncbi:hypothetical protein BDDG_00383 [Blastomyces dermatitidis ATCC 18188]|uniref:Uncharacterized protein n=1 Tax=Ajellomyces dermatitidis (strain ATCC 18188 / CBS 674.68) TaxID=653446 RepID=F2T1W2_AJEDA|nr:hypothetical protein BDDG_00383 [Blastomyces dermatitidis ATCC 18188]EQL38436.1 hypothetical protein BDFG_00045 [Blastomyces dermatitidis ATCC 26199]
MDEFAQTRGVDDLFDDEIIPLPPQEVVIEYPPEPVPEPAAHEPTLQRPTSSGPRPPSQPRASHSPGKQQQQQQQQQQQEQSSHESPAPPEAQHNTGAAGYRDGNHNRGRGNGRGYSGERGRGRGRGGGGANGGGRGGRGGRRVRSQGVEASRDAPTPPPAAGGAEGEEQVGDAKEGGGDVDGKEREEIRDGENGGDEKTKEQSTPAPAPSPAPRTFAVKGDRSGTGGVKKPKLTEDELTERMKAAKLKAAERAAAHARAEADEASFLERERIAAEKRREEMQNRRVMNGERERNRQRKLDAQTRREWDIEKSAEAFAPTAGRGRGGAASSYRRGAHGGVLYDGATTAGAGDGMRGQTEEPFTDPDDGGYFRGRGSGRGNPRRGRGGRGRGRGDYAGRQMYGGSSGPDVRKWVEGVSPHHPPPEPPRVSAEEDFPALPSVSGGGGNGNRNGNGKDDVTTPLSPQGTWAEQVEMTQEERKTQQQSLHGALSSMSLKEKEKVGS